MTFTPTEATCHIEADPGQRYTFAASLAEVIEARDTGDVEAVRSYEQVYGVVPEVRYRQMRRRPSTWCSPAA